jgi:hypothetical protein
MRSFVSGIQAAVTEPTHIYASSVSGRYLFASQDVQSRAGHPMSVVVVRENERGKILTASIRAHHSEPLVYSSANSVYSNFDKDADIFYLSKGQAREAYAEDFSDDERLWLRRAEDDGAPIGITAFDFRSHWGTKIDVLINAVSRFLGILPSEVEVRALAALRRVR